jgi:ketosteroid isomerase-like protein
MSDEARNVEVLKAAYDKWAPSKGGSVDDWIEICDNNIAFGLLAQGAPQAAAYMTSYSKRDTLKDSFAGLSRDWDMLDWRTEKFIAQGDSVVVISQISWRFKKTGKVVSTPKADVWKMSGGKAVEYFEYYDTAQVHAAVARA